jgi:protocatechuate 3,4-dioxygenase beta subunit
MIKKFRISSAFIVMAFAAAFAWNAAAQTATKGNQATSTISGHVTVEDKPATAVTVVLAPCDNGRTQNAAPVKTTTTDSEGYYQLTAVPAGHYCVNAFAPVWVLQPKPGYFGVDMNIAAGETVDNIDMALKKGGVITGRVLDSDGQPMIGDNVSVQMVGERNGQNYGKTEFTDDRGVYRIYGLPPGNYRVSVGSFGENGGSARGGLRTHPATYYAEEAGETNATKAKPIPVSIEDETTDIDITVRPVTTYSVSGTVVDGQTGQPFPNIRLECVATTADGRSTGAISAGQYTSDRTGAFVVPNQCLSL